MTRDAEVGQAVLACPTWDSSLLGVGCDESQEVLMGVGKHGEQGADGIPAPLTPALAWRSSRIPAEPYPPASNSIVSGMTLAVKR